MTRGRLIFVNGVGWPSEAASAQLLDELSRALAERGHEVTVLTAGLPGSPQVEHHGGVTYQRLGQSRWSRRRALWTRAFGAITFSARATRAVAAWARPGDTCIVLSDPPLVGVGVAWAARQRGAQVAQWCHDLYPEVAIALCRNRIGRGLLRLLLPLRDWSWRQSATCVVLGTDMRARCAARRLAVPLRLAANWALHRPAASDGRRARREWAVEDRFVLMYSGNFGRVHAFDSLLELAARLQPRDNIVLMLIGDGPRRAAVEAAARQRGLRNVRWLPPQPREQLAESLAAADLHVITLRNGCEGLVWPSKFYGIVAAGRPVLYLGPPGAEVARLVSHHALGFAGDHASAPAAAEFVRQLVDDPGAAAARRRNVLQFHATLPGLAGAVDYWSDLHARAVPARAAVA